MTKALEELHKNRPQGSAGAGKSDGSAGSSQGVHGGHSSGSAGGGGQQGTGQGDKKSLKQAELAKALDDFRAKRVQQQGG